MVKLKARETCLDLGTCDRCLTKKLPTFQCQVGAFKIPPTGLKQKFSSFDPIRAITPISPILVVQIMLRRETLFSRNTWRGQQCWWRYKLFSTQIYYQTVPWERKLRECQNSAWQEVSRLSGPSLRARKEGKAICVIFLAHCVPLPGGGPIYVTTDVRAGFETRLANESWMNVCIRV